MYNNETDSLLAILCWRVREDKEEGGTVGKRKTGAYPDRLSLTLHRICISTTPTTGFPRHSYMSSLCDGGSPLELGAGRGDGRLGSSGSLTPGLLQLLSF